MSNGVNVKDRNGEEVDELLERRREEKRFSDLCQFLVYDQGRVSRLQYVSSILHYRGRGRLVHSGVVLGCPLSIIYFTRLQSVAHGRYNKQDAIVSEAHCFLLQIGRCLCSIVIDAVAAAGQVQE